MISPSTATDSRAWREARNVLAVRLDNLGDVVMTGPALAAIKHHAPHTRLTLLASPSGAAAAAHMPMIDEVIRYEAPWVKRADGVGPSATSPGAATNDSAMVDLLRSGRYDAAIVFTVCTQSALPAALMLYLAGVPLRAAHTRENPYALLTHWIMDTEVVADGMRHEVARQLDLVRALGYASGDERLVFRYSDAQRASMECKMREAGLPDGAPYFVVHAGATAESRRYPAAGFDEAVRVISARSGCTAVFVGTGSELNVIEAARGSPKQGVTLAGQLSLGELAALLDGAAAMVCNNSGPAHIAAAQGTPTVVLYALTNPQHTPWRVASRVLSVDVPCRNCLKSTCPLKHHDCLRLVSPQSVAQAALELMGFDAQPGSRAAYALGQLVA
jgi:lipopolysaccharide heptosyltransferase II